jgi:hypothetical protein
MKTKLTQRRIKARKSSSCAMCKPWKQGWADKKTVGDIRHAQRAEQQLREAGLRVEVCEFISSPFLRAGVRDEHSPPRGLLM